MFKLKKIDRDILRILEEVFFTKRINPIQSDDHMRLWIIRTFFVVLVLLVVVKIVSGLFGQSVSGSVLDGIRVLVVLFFGVLFLHINNELEEASLIVFVLTLSSIVIGLYL